MPRTSPCLWFDNQAEEAANFYCSIFPNSKIKTITHFGANMPGPGGGVLTVSFELDGQDDLALNGGPLFKFSEAISLCVYCKSQDEIDAYWEKLTAGGGEPGVCGLAQGQIRPLLAGDPRRLGPAAQGQDAGRPGYGGRHENEEDRSGGDPAGLRGPLILPFRCGNHQKL